MQRRNPWKTLSSRRVYTNPWIKVREDEVIRPDGNKGIYGVVQTRVATGVVAVSSAGLLHLVGQYRYTVGEYSWEIVEGGAEEGEKPLEAAKRELREEAGLEADSWEALGQQIHLSNCISSEVGYLFLARELREVDSNPDPTEVLELGVFSLQQCFDMMDSGEIKDSMTHIGICHYARLYSSQNPPK